MLLETTALVDALPTSIDPPSTVYPKKDETLEMMNAKNSDFMTPIQKNQLSKSCCKPAVKSDAVII